MIDLSNPQSVMEQLAAIEDEMAMKQNSYEDAARAWFKAKHEIERDEAVRTLRAVGANITERKIIARTEADLERLVHEAEFEALRRKFDVLETRATICQSILKAQGRF